MKSLDDLIAKAVPKNILAKDLKLEEPLSIYITTN
jgi:hypothetical protein